MIALPHSIEAERAVLGGLMLDSVSASEISEMLDEEDFYRKAHGRLFTLLVTMADRGEPTEMVAVVEKAAGSGRGEELGGLSYISALPDNVPSTENLEYYVGIVRKYAEARALIVGAREIVEELGRGDTAPVEAREQMLDLAMKGGEAIETDSAWIGDVVESVDTDLDEELAGNRTVFMATGIITLDEAHDFGGLTTQGVTMLIGASGMGKTSLLNRWALGMAKLGEQVYLYGTETGMKRRTRDLQFSLAGVDLRWWSSSVKRYVEARNLGQRIPDLEDAVLSARARLRQASCFLAELPLVVNNAGRTVDQVCRQIRQYHRKGQCTVAFVDYLQDFSTTPGIPPDTSSQSIHASRLLKELSAKLEIPVIVGAQRAGEQELNAKLAEATDKNFGSVKNRLIPTQVQWTSKAKQDAEEAFALYRRDYYADLYPEIAHLLPGRPGCIELVARKRRAGPLNTWVMDFDGPTKWVGTRAPLLRLPGDF